MFNNKKGAIAIIIAVILAIIILIMLFTYAARECNSDSECAEEEYCASDFSCHPVPIVQETYVTNNVTYNLTKAALILGLAIVVAAYILRKKRDEEKRTPKGPVHYHPPHSPKPHSPHDKPSTKTKNYFEESIEELKKI
ncbi:hypothetical protein ACFL0W_04685 [Nanoarchaeota archaeon]